MDKTLGQITQLTDRLTALEQAPPPTSAIFNRLIVQTANIRDLAVTDAKIVSASVTKLTAGTLTVQATMGAGGVISSGQTAYDTGTGFWLEYNGGTPRFSLGNSAGNKVTWNGATLAVTGTITATAGTIGGWSIGATTISSTGVTLTSSGTAASIAFGTTPPTSPSAGTGIYIDKTGLYGLAANVKQFYVQATDGKAYFAAGSAILDTAGITISGNSSLNVNATPTALGGVDYNGVLSSIALSGAVSGTNNVAGFKANLALTQSGTLTTGTAFYANADIGGGIVSTLRGVYAVATNSAGAASSNVLGVQIDASGGKTSTVGVQMSIVGNAAAPAYGINIVNLNTGSSNIAVRILEPIAAANNYAIHSSSLAQSVIGGKLRVGGVSDPSSTLDVTGTLATSGAATLNSLGVTNNAAVSGVLSALAQNGLKITGSAAGTNSGATTIVRASASVTDYTVTIPNATDTLVNLASIQTLTNKTITSPTIDGHATIEGVTATGATGTGKFVFDGSPTIVTPTIASLTNMQHNHTNAAGGGQLTSAGLSDYANTTWSPTYTNVTVGNGTVVARYVQVGKLIHAYYKLTWGSTTSFAGVPIVSLPVASNANIQGLYASVGTATFFDTSATTYFEGRVKMNGASMSPFFPATATHADGNVTATVPMTWATGDILFMHAVYEAA